MATAHKRYNNIDRLIVRGEETLEPDNIKNAMVDFYKQLYSETESWRPNFDYMGFPTIIQEEQVAEKAFL